MIIESGKATHKGMVRSNNEDSFLAIELVFNSGSDRTAVSLYAVADGVGGYQGGEFASQLALKVLTSSIVPSLVLPVLQGDSIEFTQELILQKLKDGIIQANNQVYLESKSKGSGMGTTLAAVLVVNDTAYIANIGDSRVYLLKKRHFSKLTVDHSLVAAMVASGEITPQEVYNHPRRNIITRCLGTQEHLEVDLFTETLEQGVSFLLCSDGLWEMVRDDKIKELLLKSPNPQTACDKLVELANLNGGTDNVSVILAKILE
jgi:PPM family protein phosphatase